MMRSVANYKTKPINLTVDTNYINWLSAYPAVVVCEKSEELAYYANLRTYIPSTSNVNDSDLFKYVKELIFFDGTLTMLRDCQSREKFVTEPSDKPSLRDWQEEKDACDIFKDDVIKYQQLRRSCDDIFFKCSWNDKEFKCCEKFMVMSTIYGKCFAWNSLVAM